MGPIWGSPFWKVLNSGAALCTFLSSLPSRAWAPLKAHRGAWGWAPLLGSHLQLPCKRGLSQAWGRMFCLGLPTPLTLSPLEKAGCERKPKQTSTSIPAPRPNPQQIHTPTHHIHTPPKVEIFPPVTLDPDGPDHSSVFGSVVLTSLGVEIQHFPMALQFRPTDLSPCRKPGRRWEGGGGFLGFVFLTL